MYIRASLFFAILALLLPLPAFTQGIEQSVDLVIESIPVDPRPGQNVVLEAKSFSIDLNRANISWQYTGKVVASGVGQKRISVTAPAAGAVASVTAVVSASGISPVSATVVLRPGSIDLLWEPLNATTPPFYKGRSLLAPGGLVNVVAMPAPGAPRQTSFEWSRNNSALPSLSGVSRSNIVIKNTIFNNRESVSVSASGGLFQGNGNTSISLKDPFTVSYQKKEGFIDYANGSKGDVVVEGPGTVIVFEPFFFSTPRGIYDDLVFNLKVNGEQIFDDPENELRVSRPEEGGSATLDLSVNTMEYSLQNIRQVFSLIFQ